MNFADLKQKVATSGILTNPLYIKYRQYVVPGIVLVIALLISGLVTVPQIFRLFETFKTIDELNKQKEFYQNKNAELQTLDLVTYQEDLDTALLALPVDKNITGVTGELLTALSGSGMTLDGITFANTPLESEKIEEFTLRMDVSGTETELKNFLERVKMTPRIVKMTSLEIGKSKDSRMAISVGFVTLYQQLPKNISAVDEPLPSISQDESKILAGIKAKAESLPSATSNSGTGNIGKLNPFAP